MVHRSETELVLDDLVFASRNQEYGAYNIRKIYNSNLLKSVAAGSQKLLWNNHRH
jgi:hypothetical protein